ncbi:MAG: hypothetical protein JJE13_02605 [Thermoleophilia bacterium]|nr:hypothetical protein [Thermoleophilia bacterium]
MGQALILEIFRSAMTLDSIVDSILEDLPKDSFPGEDPAKVLFEMMAGSAQPAIEAAGESQCRAAIALMGAVVDRVMTDLKEAARLARP